MKTIYVLAGLLALSMVALTFVAPVAATGYSLAMINTRHGRNYTWYIDTTSDGSNGPFSGFLVDTNTIVAKCWGADAIEREVFPDNIVLAENYVELHFKNQDLPKTAIGSRVTGSLTTTTGDTFTASGPGWTFGSIHG
jgi:hypothetical protein